MKNNYLYSELLLPRLCDRHLIIQYDLVWQIYDQVTHDPAIVTDQSVEFIGFPLHVAYRMNAIASELTKRGILPRKKPLSPHDVYPEPLFQIMRELTHYLPGLTRPGRILCKKNKNCILER